MTNNKQQTAVDVAELAKKLYPFSNPERNAFIAGYNKAKETHKYTEKDLMNLVQKSHEIYNEGLGVATDSKKQKLIDFIQSVKPVETYGGNK
jgi:predicted secreted Zn-dependent protease